ncbi:MULTISPECIES: hypothetical protein [unclassified Microcoleus]|uniref:hypothetical protein n=1 Tax=unclassified Microcoleus TaxID=2642155 RepID=UPI002FD37EA0
MNKEHNATPEPQASPLSSCELALEDLELVGRELLDEELEVVVGGDVNLGVFGFNVGLNMPGFL